eukprot:m.247824 g.247824  ORF g.247824 m.247824 type:complete len:526 (+) comp15532_c0_seq1:90-1667(+)
MSGLSFARPDNEYASLRSLRCVATHVIAVVDAAQDRKHHGNGRRVCCHATEPDDVTAARAQTAERADDLRACKALNLLENVRRRQVQHVEARGPIAAPTRGRNVRLGHGKWARRREMTRDIGVPDGQVCIEGRRREDAQLVGKGSARAEDAHDVVLHGTAEIADDVFVSRLVKLRSALRHRCRQLDGQGLALTRALHCAQDEEIGTVRSHKETRHTGVAILCGGGGMDELVGARQATDENDVVRFQMRELVGGTSCRGTTSAPGGGRRGSHGRTSGERDGVILDDPHVDDSSVLTLVCHHAEAADPAVAARHDMRPRIDVGCEMVAQASLAVEERLAAGGVAKQEAEVAAEPDAGGHVVPRVCSVCKQILVQQMLGAEALQGVVDAAGQGVGVADELLDVRDGNGGRCGAQKAKDGGRCGRAHRIRGQPLEKSLFARVVIVWVFLAIRALLALVVDCRQNGGPPCAAEAEKGGDGYHGTLENVPPQAQLAQLGHALARECDDRWHVPARAHPHEEENVLDALSLC